MSQPALSVVVPVFNERDNVAPLVGEITAALRGAIWLVEGAFTAMSLRRARAARPAVPSG